MGKGIISSPDSNVIGKANVTITDGNPRLLLVNGHWNKMLHKIDGAPGEGGQNYWLFFLGRSLNNFLSTAKQYFGDSNYQSEPIYIDGSTKWGGDENGNQRKNRGYQYAQEHFKEIAKGIGTRKIYIISHSEGGAFAAGIAKYLIEKGIEVGESIMLAADEGDEFTVEGNYHCYQIVGGWLSSYMDIQTRKKKNVFAIDPVVRDNMIKGVDKYGVCIINNAGLFTVHGGIINQNIFNIINQLKTVKVLQAFSSKGKIIYYAEPDNSEIWHKINNTYVHNKRIDSYFDNFTQKFRID